MDVHVCEMDTVPAQSIVCCNNFLCSFALLVHHATSQISSHHAGMMPLHQTSKSQTM